MGISESGLTHLYHVLIKCPVVTFKETQKRNKQVREHRAANLRSISDKPKTQPKPAPAYKIVLTPNCPQ